MNLMNKNMISFITAVSFMMCACTDTTVIPAGDYDSMKGSGNGNSDAEWAVSSIEPLANPDRGYHLECRYFAHNLVNPFNSSEEYPKGFVDDREITYSSKDGSTKIVQQYIYLTGYARKDIDEQGLENVQKVFDGLKDKGYKTILRFAYNWWGENQYNSNWKDEEEEEEWIYRHIEQLAPVLQKNIGLIAAMQAGFLGRWGEWHNTSVLLGPNAQRVKNGVVNKLLAAIPEPYNIEMRYPSHKNALTLDNETYRTTRLGYCNDFFTVGEHALAAGNDFVPGSEEYNQVMNEAYQIYISGEMPYPEESEWGLSDLISRTGTLQIFRDHHYSAFDITQNENINVHSWKNSSVTPSELTRNRILFDESYFVEDGKNVARTFYDFVRDHLGYRINVKKVELNAENGSLAYKIDLTNTGFATVINPKEVYLVLISEDSNEVKELKKLEVDPRDWQPYDVARNDYKVLTHTLEGTVEVTGISGKYKVGIWMPEVASDLKYNSKYAVKFALSDLMTSWNDEEGKYAVNVIGEVSL